MVGIVAHWKNAVEIAKNPHATKKLLTHWTLTAKAFGVKNIIMVDVEKTQPFIGDAEINFEVYPNLNAVYRAYPNEKYVYIEQGGEPLVRFKHPQEALYILGGDYSGMVIPAGATIVSIDSKITLYAEIAAGIVLHDRQVKLGS